MAGSNHPNHASSDVAGADNSLFGSTSPDAADFLAADPGAAARGNHASPQGSGATYTVYEYGTLNHGGSYTLNHGAGVTESLPYENLANGQTFTFGGGTYTYLGGADNTSGAEVGFFAVGPDGRTKLFSDNPQGNQSFTLNAEQPYTICFMAGTQVATPTGTTNVETLAIGDMIVTSTGEAAPVRWIGRQTIATRFADPVRSLPVRIAAGAFGDNLPVRDLLVSPGHAFLLDGILVQAGALVNGTTVTRETALPETFVYYHVELDSHALLLAEGVPAETYVDNIERLAFDNWAEHEALYPNGRDIAEMDLPRAASARQVPGTLAARIAAQAETLAEGLRAAA